MLHQENILTIGGFNLGKRVLLISTVITVLVSTLEFNISVIWHIQLKIINAINRQHFQTTRYIGGLYILETELLLILCFRESCHPESSSIW